MDTRKLLIYLSILHGGDWDSIYAHITSKVCDIDPLEVENVTNTLKCGAVTIVDPEYPHHLRQVFKPPFVLFYYGDLSLIKEYNNRLSVVGARNVTDYGKRMTKEIVSELADKLVIVSGLANGVDGLAHKACIDSGGKTVAVIGNGIDICYPSSNKDLYETIKRNHLVISEYPGTKEPNQHQFPQRNRIIAGLSSALLIPYARKYSGSAITAGLMIQLSRDVYCVPTEAGQNSLCNYLIKEGATLVECAEDILKDMECMYKKI